ncbi:hypothetical protein FB451DRAFT_1365463 [Mycena latifolia]|nr:hypothetical protein FB451DRAFT_1365463 [Mycena latifolia]
MTTNVAIVDDGDLQYSGTWVGGGAPIEYRGTTKWSSAKGSTASLTFVGTSITVYASVSAQRPAASLSFAVDESITGSYTSAANLDVGLYHEALWTSPTLSDGTHTLVITQTAAQSTGVIYLDYLLYDTTSAAVSTYFIDDRDSRITYTPAWTKFDGTANDFQHTSQKSTNQGDSLSLRFEGKSVQFYGGITPSGAGLMKASMVLDGGAPVVYTAPQDPPAPVNNLIFDSGGLSDGTHTLVVTAANDQSLWADFFLVTPNTPSATDPPAPPPSTPGSVSTSGSTATSPGGTTSVSSGTTSVSSGSHSAPSGSHSVASSGSTIVFSPGSSPSSPSSPSSLSSAAAADAPLSSDSSSQSAALLPASKTTSVAAIVAAVLGALLLVALVVGVILFVRRRKRKTTDPPEAKTSVLTPRPFSGFGSGTSSAGSSREPLNFTYASLAAGSTTNLESSEDSTAPPLVSEKRELEALREAPQEPRGEDPEEPPQQRATTPSATLSGAASIAGTGTGISQFSEAPPQYSA